MDNQIRKIDLKQYKQIVVLTGAGISVASGLETYRGKDSKKNNIERLAHIDRLQDDPLAIWQVFNSLREKSIAAKPNKIHRLLADIESNAQGEFTIITQNVDRLHHRGGSNNVVELHGRIDLTCCSNSECNLQPYFDDRVYQTTAPLCP